MHEIHSINEVHFFNKSKIVFLNNFLCMYKLSSV